MANQRAVAIAKLDEILGELDEKDLRIVLGYIRLSYGEIRADVYGEPQVAVAGTFVSDDARVVAEATNGGEANFNAFHDLYHQANPATEAEKALVAGYWVQVCQSNEGFESFAANSALKGMGYTVSNITRAIDSLMAQDPKYVMQIKKTGTSRQARKVYKLTSNGIRRVKEMLGMPNP